MEKTPHYARILVIKTWSYHVENEVSHVNHLNTDNCSLSEAGLQNTTTLACRQEIRLRSKQSLLVQGFKVVCLQRMCRSFSKCGSIASLDSMWAGWTMHSSSPTHVSEVGSRMIWLNPLSRFSLIMYKTITWPTRWLTMCMMNFCLACFRGRGSWQCNYENQIYANGAF